LIGLVLGLVIPQVGVLLYYLFRDAEVSFVGFIRIYLDLGILTHILSLAVLPNLLVFFGFIRLNWLYAARGVLAATILYAILVAIVRFI